MALSARPSSVNSVKMVCHECTALAEPGYYHYTDCICHTINPIYFHPPAHVQPNLEPPSYHSTISRNKTVSKITLFLLGRGSRGPLVPWQCTVNSALFPHEGTMWGDGPVGSCPCNSTNSRLRTLIRDDAMVYVVSCSVWAIMTACLGGCQCTYLTAMYFDKRVAPCY